MIGNVTLGKHASIWYGAVLRGESLVTARNEWAAVAGRSFLNWIHECAALCTAMSQHPMQHLHLTPLFSLVTPPCAPLCQQHNTTQRPHQTPKTPAGDINSIVIGDKTNIQDNAIIHVAKHSSSPGQPRPTIVGNAVTVGHGATLHACTVGDGCLVRVWGVVCLFVCVLSDSQLVSQAW